MLSETGKKDLRLCGIAALSSSMIHRLKVESIFRLDKISNQPKMSLVQEASVPIVDLNTIELPFRLESTYPVSLEDLIQMMENMIFELSSPDHGRRKLSIEPVQADEIEEYSHKFEKIILEFEQRILHAILLSGEIMFKKFASEFDPIDIARYFIALLYLATEDKIRLEICEESEDIKIMLR
jgi:segregation and condensation protein A